MDPELKKLLEDNLKLSQENNEILRGMRRRAQWSLVGQAIMWILLVIAPLIFLWGYIGPLMSAVNGGNPSTGFSTQNLQNLIKQYQAH